MKKHLSFFKYTGALFFITFLFYVPLKAQQRNLKTELLVYILPDSLELPRTEKGLISYEKASILSKSLKNALIKIKPVAIGRSLPNWNPADSIKTREDGTKIKAPAFDRIFTLVFKSEEEANAAIEVLNKLPAVLFAEKNNQAKPFNDPDFISGTQWHLNNDGRNGGVVRADIHAPEAWNIFTGSSAITIGIFDSGVLTTHPDLSGKAIGDGPLGIGHGTHVAGIAAARANNSQGGRGVDWNAQIRSERIFDGPDVFNPSYIGDAAVADRLTNAVNSGVQIFNHSWGGPTRSNTLAMAFAYAYKMNRTSVVAMGNNNGNEIRYPAAFNNVIAVGATRNNDDIAPFSNTGNHIDVTAPGGVNPPPFGVEDIYSLTLGNGYAFEAGTSMAAPQVAGLASLLKGFRNNLANDDIENIIRLSADDRGPAGWDPEFGTGRINAGNALSLLLAPNSVYHYTTSGGTIVNSVGFYSAVFHSVPGLPNNTYLVKRHEVRQNVAFPNGFCNIVGAWGRGVGSTGYSMANPNFAEGFTEIVPGTLTNTGATLRTYIYEVYNNAFQYMGTYPTTAQNITFAYTVLGNAAPAQTGISGPPTVCQAGTTFSINLPAGVNVTWSVSPNLTILSAQGANPLVVQANGSGNGWIGATISNSCGSIVLPSRNVWAGTPSSPGSISGPSSLCPNSGGYYTTGYSSGALSYNWVYSGLQYYSGGYSNDITLSAPSNFGGGFIQVSAQNECGSSTPAYLSVSRSYSCSGYYTYSVSPNPSKDDIKIKATKERDTVGATTVTKKPKVEAKLYYFTDGSLTKSYQVDKEYFVVNTTKFKRGKYILHILEDDKVVVVEQLVFE